MPMVSSVLQTVSFEYYSFPLIIKTAQVAGLVITNYTMVYAVLQFLIMFRLLKLETAIGLEELNSTDCWWLLIMMPNTVVPCFVDSVAVELRRRDGMGC